MTHIEFDQSAEAYIVIETATGTEIWRYDSEAEAIELQENIAERMASRQDS